MSKVTVWGSRDVGKNHIKIWNDEPRLVEENGAWVGKTYLGISCAEKWPGPQIVPGTCTELNVSFTEVQEK